MSQTPVVVDFNCVVKFSMLWTLIVFYNSVWCGFNCEVYFGVLWSGLQLCIHCSGLWTSIVWYISVCCALQCNVYFAVLCIKLFSWLHCTVYFKVLRTLIYCINLHVLNHRNCSTFPLHKQIVHASKSITNIWISYSNQMPRKYCQRIIVLDSVSISCINGPKIAELIV